MLLPSVISPLTAKNSTQGKTGGLSLVANVSQRQKRMWKSDAGKTRCWWHGMCGRSLHRKNPVWFMYADSANNAFYLKTDTNLL